MIKYLSMALGILFFMFCTTDLLAQTFSVGMVDLQSVIEQKAGPKIRKIKEGLQAKFLPRGQKITALRKELVSGEKTLKKEGATMSLVSRDALQKKLAKQLSTLRSNLMSFQEDSLAAQNEAQAKIKRIVFNVMKQIRQVVPKIAAKRKLALVLPKDVILYPKMNSKSNKDLTQAVLKHLK